MGHKNKHPQIARSGTQLLIEGQAGKVQHQGDGSRALCTSTAHAAAATPGGTRSMCLALPSRARRPQVPCRGCNGPYHTSGLMSRAVSATPHASCHLPHAMWLPAVVASSHAPHKQHPPKSRRLLSALHHSHARVRPRVPCVPMHKCPYMPTNRHPPSPRPPWRAAPAGTRACPPRRGTPHPSPWAQRPVHGARMRGHMHVSSASNRAPYT